jgi:cyclophilin family peptidyl-prolyl cis-trans isomerase
MLGPAPHLDGGYVIFGEVVAGLEVVDRVNDLSRGRPDNTAGAAAGAVIVDSGQLR